MRRLGLLLSPYRNLTTLCCAALALHPHIQVMNHGFARIEEAGGLKFMVDQTPENLDYFSELLVSMSEGGRQGDHGGSIIYSHAFEKEGVKEAYQTMIGDVQIKHDIRAVVWKDGGRLREYLKQRAISPLVLAEKFPSLCFISPVRNLLDNAYGLKKFYETLGLQSYVTPSLPDLEMHTILRYIVACHYEFWSYARAMPDRFFMFGENDMGDDVLEGLAKFLGVQPSGEWTRSAGPLFVSSVHYHHAPEHAAMLQQIIAEPGAYRGDFLQLIGPLSG